LAYAPRMGTGAKRGAASTADRMHVVGLFAQKGGAGKTTLSLHFAVEAQRHGASVVVVDVDIQQSSAKWAQVRDADEPKVVLAQPAGDRPLAQILDLCREDARRYVFVDTMPRVEASAFEVAKLATFAVIPTAPHKLDIEALTPTVELMARVGLKACIVLNHCRPGSSVNAAAIRKLEGYGLPVCPALIYRRAVLADAFNDGRAVVEVEPNGKATQEVTAAWRWITKQMER